MNVYMEFDNAGYKLVNVQDWEVGIEMVESVLEYERKKEHEHLNAEDNEDWGTIIEIAGRVGYYVLPMEDKSVNTKVIRLIAKDLITPVRKVLIRLYHEVEKNYWTIQGNAECLLLAAELENLAEQNINLHEAIGDISVQQRNRYLFNRNYFNDDWKSYKDQLQLLVSHIPSLVKDKVPEASIRRLYELSKMYAR